MFASAGRLVFSEMGLAVHLFLAVALAFSAYIAYVSYLLPVEEVRVEENGWFGTGELQPDDVTIHPFEVNVTPDALQDLKERLERSRITHSHLEDSDDFWYGFNSDELEVHFIHEPAAKGYRKVLPLLMVHGWPGNVYEFYKIIPMLTNPKKHGIDSDVSNLISQAQKRVLITWKAIRWVMVLIVGRSSFTRVQMEFRFLTSSPVLPSILLSLRYFEGTALNDSPIGLAAYILEKFSTWTKLDHRSLRDGGLTKKFTRDELLTIVMIYWLNGNIVSSQRFYREFFLDDRNNALQKYVVYSFFIDSRRIAEYKAVFGSSNCTLLWTERDVRQNATGASVRRLLSDSVTSKELSDEQRNAVQSAILCNDYILIEGFPGSGKTTTVVAMLRCLLEMNRSVLLAANTHSALDNVLAKLRKHTNDSKILRIGNSGSVHHSVADLTLESKINSANEDKYTAARKILKDTPLVASTCHYVPRDVLFSWRKFDYCIIDEASMVLEPVILSAIAAGSRFVLVGDAHQLSPLVQNRKCSEEGMSVSLFERLQVHTEAKHSLESQYRMNSTIAKLSSNLFYENRLRCANEDVARACLSSSANFKSSSSENGLTNMSPLRVLVTGAAGQIGYSLVLQIAKGDVFGKDTPIVLVLLDIPPMATALEGVEYELQDCALANLKGVECVTTEKEAFTGIDYAFLVGAMPRKEGMERKDLLAANVKIFKSQGKALADFAKPTTKVIVVGNPANTNAFICAKYAAPKIPARNFSAMTRLDHNRATAQLAMKAGVSVGDVKNVIIWGNHSSTQFPDVKHAVVTKGGQDVDAYSAVNDTAFLQGPFISTIQKRGAVIIQKRKLSSAMSAAKAACDHIHDWHFGTKPGEWISMAVPSDGSYGIPNGLMFSFPVMIDGATKEWKIVQGLPLDDFAKSKLAETQKELEEERDDALKACDAASM
ncbi:hypothetical protein GCK32_007846 [Trichostrongylus colubriformis]|uniref:Malate dehydrogenase, cytoplasmic n=1 Tax=Trichostrongylus colubriformis TaxID=6319 RepID=A0AAN8ET45_TRICO